MSYKRYRFWYFNLILIFFTLVYPNVYIFIIIFLWKLAFLANLYSDTYVEFFNPVRYVDFQNFDNKYVDFDNEEPNYYTMIYQEYYALYNCRFSFDIFGGSNILDDCDFIDVNLYLDNRNFKNVYKKINFKYTNKNNYILYNFKDDYINSYNRLSKLDDLELYNIEFSSMLKDNINEVKRTNYLNIIKNNPKNIDEKNL